MDEELPTTLEQALARARAEASELRRMVEVQEAAMATAAARQQRNGDAVAYAATLERWRQEVFAGAVRRRIHADQGVHLHAARRAAADAIRTAALCERRWRAAQAHAAAADAARRESEELLGRERRGVVHACRNAFDAMRCVEIKILRRVRAESPRRPPRHRRDACSMAWRCRFLAARPSQDSRVIAEK